MLKQLENKNLIKIILWLILKNQLNLSSQSILIVKIFDHLNYNQKEILMTYPLSMRLINSLNKYQENRLQKIMWQKGRI